MMFMPFMLFVLFQDQPPAHVEQKATAMKQRKSPQGVRQSSTGPNSPNIVTGDHSTINIGPKLSGVLLPDANGKRPVFRFPIPDDELVARVGGSTMHSKGKSFVAVRWADEDVVTVHSTGDGLTISARVYSADGRIVADIENNEFTVNPNNYFKIKRPDRSTLVVYNQTDEECLNVKYVATRYLTITGIFYKPGRGKLVMTPEGMILP